MDNKARSHLRTASWLVAGCAALVSLGASALEFNIPVNSDNTIDGVLNTTITVGGAWRMHSPSTDLIGKADLNPDVCGRAANGKPLYQSCQGLFREQALPAYHLSQAPGQFTMNGDDGNLNYGRGAPTSGIAKVTQDISLKWGDFGFFAKALYFYDWVNNNFTENHPNYVTKDNYLQVGAVSSLATDTLPRSDSRPCGSRNPTIVGPCGIVYGKGAQVYSKRTDGETLKEIGTDLQPLDYFFYGKLPLPFDKQLTFKIGSQSVNWGESTLLAFGSINQANPINANNFYRIGGQVEEIFRPSSMLFLSTEPFEGTTIEGYYQLEWIPLEAPAPGSFLSFLDLGPKNAGNNWANLSFGGAADDPDIDPNAMMPNAYASQFIPSHGGYARLQDNSLSGLTNTSLRAERLRDNEPNSSGQFGLALKYYADWLNNGTELGFYFEKYHSRIPFVSVYSTVASCARPEGNNLGINPTNTATFFAACKNMPIEHSLAGLGVPSGLPAATQQVLDIFNGPSGIFTQLGLGTNLPVANDVY
ncbi:MAG TPA: DUF1302 family protein, partial [Nevskiaceae bacterium]|nr:DUF1302 family protein [Nevskiaceae bacterium]